MLRLPNINTSLQAVLAGAIATTQPQATVSFSDDDATNATYTGGITVTALNSTTDVTICAAPAASIVRDIDFVSIFNRDTASITLSVKYDISATDSIILTVTLLTLETLQYVHGAGWACLDAQGRFKTSVNAFTGVLPVPNGGTGFGSYTIGDLLYADSASTLAKLADIATGNALISGGVGVAPSWGKIGLTTHVSGTLPVANGGTGTTTATGTAGSVVLSVGPTITGTLTATGLVDISGASAGQIKFPATQNPSADANTLDDYEEGTFTVTATASTSGTITLDLATCTYTKVGRNVNVYGIVRVSAISAPSGIMHLNGLPFTMGDWAGLAVYADALAATAITQIMGYFESGTTRIGLFKYSAGATTGLANNIAVNSVFMLAGSYRV